MAKKKGGKKGGPTSGAGGRGPSKGAGGKSEPETKPAPASASDPPPAPKSKSEPPPKSKSEPPAKSKSEPPPKSKSEPPAKSKSEPDGDEAAQPSSHARAPVREGAAWAKPFVRLEKAWTWVEVRLLLGVLLILIVAMVSWISLKGLSVPLESESKAGMAFRALAGGLILGALGQQAQKRAGLKGAARGGAVLGAMVIGAAMAPLWRATGVDYFGRMLNWLQEGSSLTMFGGLRGVSTRLTIILAMIGASLAAAGGKHISIDALLRFLNPKLRIVTFVLSTSATIAVCVASAWGFADYISIESFGANKDLTRGEKMDHLAHHVGQDLFLWRKQVGFDLEALPRVVGGGRWDDDTQMNGRQWNQFLDESGYRDHFTKEEVDALRAPDEDLDGSRIPMVVVPDGSPRGLLVHTMNLAFPIGLLIIAARFFLRMILVVSGHDSVEVEGEHAPPGAAPVAVAAGDAASADADAAATESPEDEAPDDGDSDAKQKSKSDEEEAG